MSDLRLKTLPPYHSLCTFIVGKVLQDTHLAPCSALGFTLDREAAHRAGRRLGLPTRVSTADVRAHNILPYAKGVFLVCEEEKRLMFI